MESQPTTGGINVFSWSVGLDVGLNDVDLNEIRGRAVALVICTRCDGRSRRAPGSVVGKVLWDGKELLWLNYFSAPRSDYKVSRDDAGGRRPAPRVVITHRLQRPGYPSIELWCETHGSLTAETTALHTAAAKGQSGGRPGRVAV